MNILSLQSMVTYGHVGHSAVQFPMQLLGHTYWPIPTVYLSHHKGYGYWTEQVFDFATMVGIAQDLHKAGHLHHVDAFMVGYLGTEEAVNAAKEIIHLLKDVAPNALIVLDPVIGDHHSGIYVSNVVLEGIQKTLLPLASVCTPNTFEYEVLLGTTDVLQAERLGCETVLVTGIIDHPNIEEDSIGMMVSFGGQSSWIQTPRYQLKYPPSGAGDLTTSLFTASLLEKKDPIAAMRHIAPMLDVVFAKTHGAQQRELMVSELRSVVLNHAHRPVMVK